MRSMKRLLCLALATGTLVTAMPIQSLAASDYKYITNISLKVDIDLDSGDEINDGDSLGTDSSDSGNKVYTSSNKYRVQSAEWSNDKEVTIGDTPKITVWLEPESSGNSNYDYRFRSSYSSGSVSVSGGTFVSASKSASDRNGVITSNGIKGTYAPPDAA
ncbi:MAG: N-acetylmuramoyl-L-alanine amidase family protein, partial [Enterocloster clostridioformis]|nr:N-acetylmuramoyl-L-alanine amidase family protein [Enterocloster clostridioformis]